MFYINKCIIKTESNDKLKEIHINNCTCYYFDDIIKIEDFDPDNILIDEKSYEEILACNVSYKSLIAAKPLRIRFDEIDIYILEVMVELDIQFYLEVKNMILFTRRLDIS